MVIGTGKVVLHAPWVHTLKEKRTIVKSLIAKVRNKFNVAINEVDKQDSHNLIVLGIACVAGNTSMADSVIENVLNFIENNTDAEVIDVKRENL